LYTQDGLVWLSEMVNCYQPTLHHILEDGNIHLIRIVYTELQAATRDPVVL